MQRTHVPPQRRSELHRLGLHLLGVVAGGLVGLFVGRATTPSPAAVGAVPYIDPSLAQKLDRLAEQLDSLDRRYGELSRLYGRLAEQGGGAGATAVSANTGSAGETPNAPPSPATPPRPSNPTARAEAERVVQAARNSRHWTESDRDTLRAQMDQLSTEDRERLVRELIIAINGGTLEMDYPGPPF